MVNLTKEAVEGVEAIGRKTKMEEDKVAVLDAVRRGGFDSRSDDPIEKSEIAKLKKSEQEREKMEAKSREPITEKNRKLVLNAIKGCS